MGISFDKDDDICGTPFYVTHLDGAVWLGVLTPYGVLAQEIDSDEWKDWIRVELARSNPAEIPLAFREIIG